MSTPKFVAPNLEDQNFTCPHCGAFASFEQDMLAHKGSPSWSNYDLTVQDCPGCDGIVIWLNSEQVYPRASIVPAPHTDTPEEIKLLYAEAADVQSSSPRAACALMRVCLQMLCKELGESGENNSRDIGELVAKGAIDAYVQKALDINRILGNSAVHPEQIVLTDAESDAMSVFLLFNYIANDHYNRLASHKAIDGAWAKIPQDEISKVNDRELGNARKRAKAQAGIK